jgi:hypothetical protein
MGECSKGEELSTLVDRYLLASDESYALDLASLCEIED